MGTKKPSCNVFDTSSNVNTSDRKLQPGGKISQDPRPAMTAQSERDREEDWRREREAEKMRDKVRHKDMDPRERYYERDRAPASRPREGEREWREREGRREDDRSRNGRPLSNVEKETEREIERGMKKGDTFPRMRISGAGQERRMTADADMVHERGERRYRDRPKRVETEEWERERERAWQRERNRERERDETWRRAREEGKNTGRPPVDDDKSWPRERFQESDVSYRDRRREEDELWDRRERDTGRRREKPRPNMGGREARVPSPRRGRDGEIYSDRRERESTQKRERWRDTRSEGESDERVLRREREREELTYQHSRSEGDTVGKTERERVRDRQEHRGEDRQRYRDREREREVDRSRRKEADRERQRCREADQRADREAERWGRSPKDGREDRRQDDRYRESEQRRRRDTEEREADPKWDDRPSRGGRPVAETAPRAPPRAQSSGEWSTTESDRDVEERRSPERGNEKSQRVKKRNDRQDREGGKTAGSVPEQRRMWLEPQRYSNSRGEFEDRERHLRERERRKEEERSMKPHAEYGIEGERGRGEPEERQRDQSSYGERPEYRGSIERESEGVSVDGEEVWGEVDKTGKEPLPDLHEGPEGSWRRDARRANVTDNTEESDEEEEGGSDYWGRSESEGGSDSGWKQDRGRMLSGEDGFVTVSSGGDEEDEREEDEEEFKDCREFWGSRGSRDEPSPERDEEREEEWTMGTEESVDEDDQGSDKQPKYVFCVIGQTLPRSEASEKSPSQVDPVMGVERDKPDLERQHHSSGDTTRQPQDDPMLRTDDEYPIINKQDAETRSGTGEGLRETSEVDVSPEPQNSETEEVMRREKENPYAEIGPINRDSQTERLLVAWREKNKEDASALEEGIPSNPYDVVSFEDLQPVLDGINTGAMSPEEVEAIRIRMSGAWSMSEEPKRHSQAPHLKWAKNVVREILGRSEEQTLEVAAAEAHRGQGPDLPGTATENNKRREEKDGEVAQEAGEMPVDKLKADEQQSEPELEEEELLEVEGLRDDEDDRSKSWEEVELRTVLDTIDRKKRNSRFFNAAQLYQQYSEAAQNFEILRQARSEVISVCEDISHSPAPSPPPARRPLPPLPPVQHPSSLSHAGSITSVQSLPLPEPPRSERRPSSPRLSISLTQSSTLWRELPGVRNSAELEELTEDQRRLQEVRFEVVTSEASYCRSLDIVVEHFVKSKQLGALLTTQDRNWLFSRLADVRAISHSFLSRLEERLESDIMHFTVCDIIARHCQRFKMVYVPYLTNQSYQDATYQRLMNENQGFKRVVDKLERSPVCQRLPLRSFLVLPFQRITRIKLLVQNIVKRTTPGTAEATQAIKALKQLEKLIQESNDSITQMKSIESLVSLSAKVDFECRTLPLISQSRRLVREGPVTELMDFSLKDTERSIYLHLFNDYLLLSLQKEGGRFTVIDHSPVSDLRAENCRVKLHSLQKNLFRLHMSHRALLLRTDTQSDKLRWISALSRPHPEIDFSAAQDFAQMQCIRACVGQQPDELSLEKADIILVHQQSSDHWVEGTRLSDRHRGWVPESHLETISNSRVRQRNLSDALKLTTATAAV